VTRKAPGEILIDHPPPELADEAPLPEADLAIPFFALREAKLPEARRYLLYCDRGLLSQWHGRAARRARAGRGGVSAGAFALSRFTGHEPGTGHEGESEHEEHRPPEGDQAGEGPGRVARQHAKHHNR